MTSVQLVAAVASNGVIGRGGQLPWHLPDDLRHFKKLTLGHPILMGRRTFESIGKALPGRQSIVITTTLTSPPPGVEVAPSLDEALRLTAEVDGPAFVIGGAALYAAALPIVNVLHLTEIDAAVEGDALFPPFDKTQWRLVDEISHAADARHALPLRFCTYVRSGSR